MAMFAADGRFNPSGGRSTQSSSSSQSTPSSQEYFGLIPEPAKSVLNSNSSSFVQESQPEPSPFISNGTVGLPSPLLSKLAKGKSVDAEGESPTGPQIKSLTPPRDTPPPSPASLTVKLTNTTRDVGPINLDGIEPFNMKFVSDGDSDLFFWKRWELSRVLRGVKEGTQKLKVKRTYYEAINPVNQSDFRAVWFDLKARLADQNFMDESCDRIEFPETFALDHVGGIGGEGMPEVAWDNRLQLSGKVFLRKRKGDGCFGLDFTPSPVQAVKKHPSRYWSRWGSDRFLTLDRESLTQRRDNKLKTPVKSPIKEKATLAEKEALKDLLGRLQDEGCWLFGRLWKPFYFHENKRDRTKRLGIETNSLMLFAVEGPGLQPVTIHEMISWLIPLSRNMSSSVSKLYSRISLGLSPAVPLMEYMKDDILNPLPDLFAEESTEDVAGRDLTDGCGVISESDLKYIRHHFECDFLPSVIQGRIGGCKGLWVLEPPKDSAFNLNGRRVGHTGSQIKFAVDPSNRRHRVMEVLKISKPPKPGKLNNQFIQILVHGGVPKEIFGEIIGNEVDTRIDSFFKSLDNPVDLLHWLIEQKTFTYHEDTRKYRLNDGECLPTLPIERVILLLEQGRSPLRCRLLNDSLQSVLRQVSREWGGEKIRFEIPMSTNVWCIPDFTNTLQSGEVFLRFSDYVGPNEGQQIEVLEGDVLVGRVPAYFSSDVQKVRAVKSLALMEWGVKNVIVFPTRERTQSLASKLSGGDYDGDKIFVTWDKRIVNSFNSREPDEDTDILEQFLVKETPHKVQDILDQCDGDEKAAFEIIRRTQLERALPAGFVGLSTYQYDYVSYYYGIDDSVAKVLATIANAALDAQKQAYVFDASALERLEGRTKTKIGEWPPPSYKMDLDWTDAQIGTHFAEPYSHVLDYLRFNIVCRRMDNALKRFDCLPKDWDTKLLTNLGVIKLENYRSTLEPLQRKINRGLPPTPSIHLTHEPAEILRLLGYQDFQRYMINIARRNVLNQLRRDLDDVIIRWKLKYDPNNREDTGSQVSDGAWKADKASFNQSILQQYRSILPDVDSVEKCPLVAEWASNASHLFSEWSLLRASVLLEMTTRFADQVTKVPKVPKLAWTIAWQELGRIWVETEVGRGARPFRVLSAEVYSQYKLATKKEEGTKRRIGRLLKEAEFTQMD